MARRIPAHIREQQIDNLPNITFVRWDGEYRNCNSKAFAHCDKGHEWSASVDHLIRGRGCPECARKTVADKKRTPAAERVEQINKSSNITFVRWLNGYHNAKSKAVCRCDKGHEWHATVNNLTKVNGHGCPECARKTVADKKRIPATERVEQINGLVGMRFVRWDGNYRNNQSKAVCRCDKGHEWSVNVSSLLKVNGTGCPECALESNADKQRKPREECEQQINTLTGITFVRWEGEYRNAKSKVVCCCDKGHEWSASVDNLLRGTGCPHCAEHGYNPSKPGTLYALRSECGTMVKIGISNDYTNRLTMLKRATPFDWSCTELLHGDGALIAGLEKAFHRMTEPAISDGGFDGYTEWRKWTPELTNWFNTWKSLTPKENENV